MDRETSRTGGVSIKPITVGHKRGKDGLNNLQPMKIDEMGGVMKKVKSTVSLESYGRYDDQVAGPTNRALGSP